MVKAGKMQAVQDMHQVCVPRQLAAVFPNIIQHTPGSFLAPFSAQVLHLDQPG